MGRRKATSMAMIGVLGVGTMVLAVVSCRLRSPDEPRTSSEVQAAPVGVRLSMEELHAMGGVPPGWRFTPPPGNAESGRQAFAEFGCYKCHRVAGETFPSGDEGGGVEGPDLTGMGQHHPPGYFAEAIVNPNAVVVDGPGYVSEDGSSKMPSYPDMTLAQLADLVAYLSSLTSGEEAEHHQHEEGMGGVAMSSEPKSGSSPAHSTEGHHHGHERDADGSNLSYLVQAFEAEDERIEEFYQWFDEKRFAGIAGLRSVQTYASRERPQGKHVMLVLLGFDNDAALETFRRQQRLLPVGSFPRPVENFSFTAPPLYRAAQMSHP